MRLFGRSKKKEVEGPQESIVQMRATLEMLEKKEKHLETKIVAETNTARQYAVSNKPSTPAPLGPGMIFTNHSLPYSPLSVT